MQAPIKIISISSDKLHFHRIAAVRTQIASPGPSYVQVMQMWTDVMHLFIGDQFFIIQRLTSMSLHHIRHFIGSCLSQQTHVCYNVVNLGGQ